MPVKTKSTVFERGDRIYIVSPVSPFDPSEGEIEEFAFAAEMRQQAPNPSIKWLRGQYVEADTPNKNGQVWTSGEIAIKSVTPNFMPVTVMHDPRTAVGLIADTRLLTPAADKVPKARLDNTLAIWAHRFQDVAEEIDANYEQGSLMQSMECVSPYYSCAECGQTFQKLPQGAERANWCSHLTEAAGFGARILGNVVFTGTGLIFGTRGKEGANPNSHLEVFQEEVAEFHERAHKETSRTGRKETRRRKSSMDKLEISPEEYASLSKRPTVEEFAAEKKRADDAEAEKAEADKKVEAAEIAQKKAEDEKAEADKKVTAAEEEKAESTLREERFGKLGAGFIAKLGETAKANLRKDAGKLEEEAWDNRVKEIEELAGVKRDAKGDGNTPADPLATPPATNGNGSSDEFSMEELASSAAGDSSGSGGSTQPSVNQRRSVAAGLFGKSKTTESDKS